MSVKITPLEQQLLSALEEVLPYAESRIEDMSEDAAGAAPHHRKEARRLYRLACKRFHAAQVALAKASGVTLPRSSR